MTNLESWRQHLAQIFDVQERRHEDLGSVHSRIFRVPEKNKYDLGKEFVGKTISAEKLEKIFGERGRVLIQTFATRDLPKRNWSKFAVSQTRFHFERDPNIMFFEIGKKLEGEKGVEIIYLGTGRTDKIPEIENEIAADSWGFAVLNLKEESE